MAHVNEAIDPHERHDAKHKTVDTLKTAASGSVVEAAIYLAVSILAMIGAVSVQLMEPIWGGANWTVGALFLVWLSGTTFTLGILEYRRSQQPHGAYHGPEV